MTAKHSISAVGAAIALGLFAGSANAEAGSSVGLASWAKADGLATAWPAGRPIIVTDMSSPYRPLPGGRGVDIAAIDGEIAP